GRMRPGLRVDQRTDVIDSEIEGRGIDAENPILAVVPSEVAGDRVPFPRSHLTGGERQAAAFLALHQPRGRGLELGGALGDAPLQLVVGLLELAGVSQKSRAESNLCAADA